MNKLVKQTETILKRSIPRDEKLLQLCHLLADEVPTFDWVGFYFVAQDANNELVLGPYVGAPSDHMRIPFGKGICGQVALSKQTYVSQDVMAEENYLACSVDVKSEIVVPIIVDGVFVAQLDIDSNTIHSITQDHIDTLEKICEMLSSEF